MPLKVIKNQEFCMDFCLFPEKEWETGAKMLAFKSQESIRDLKPMQMILPASAVLHILYKEEEIFCKEIEISTEKKMNFYISCYGNGYKGPSFSYGEGCF